MTSMPSIHRYVVVIAIDFGGGAVKVAILWSDGVIEYLRGFGPGNSIVSALYVDRDTGEMQHDIHAIEQAYNNTDGLAVRVKRNAGDKRTQYIYGRFTAEDVITEILRYVATLVEKQTGAKASKSWAIITAPANYSDEQKASIENAARRARYRLLPRTDFGGPLMSEPGAAIFAYVVKNQLAQAGDGVIVIVIDVGYETVDFTIARAEGNAVHSLATDGINQLGGGYIVDALETLAYELAAQKLGIDQIDRATIDPSERLAHRQKCEAFLVSIPKIGKAVVAVPVGNGQLVPITITVEQFDRLIERFAHQIEAGLRRVLDAAKLRPEQIDYPVVVGVAMQIPFLRDRVSRFFGKPVCTDVDPAFAIAEGAALYAHGVLIQTGELETWALPEGPTFNDVVPHHVGVLLLRSTDQHCVGRILFPKGAPTPSENAITVRLATPYQRKALIRLAQIPYEAAPESECTLLGDVMLDGLDIEEKLSERISLRAKYDVAGMITLTATDRVTGKSVTVTASREQLVLNDSKSSSLNGAHHE